MRTRLVILLLFAAVSPLLAQSGTDSLLAAGFRYLDAYATSHRLNDARDAHEAFSKVLKKDQHNAQAHLGLGLAYGMVEGQQLDRLGVNDVTLPVNNTMAIRHFADALGAGADPHAAAAMIVTIARREYFPERMRTALKALAAVKNPDEVVRAAMGELHISMYEPAAAESLLAKAATPTGQRLLGIAQLLQPDKVQAGGTAYLAALAEADSASLREFLRDARWLVDPDEAAEWKDLRGSALRDRIGQFWERRALKAGVSVPERLATHFQRVQHVVDEFSYYRQRIGVINGLGVDRQIDGREYDVDDRAFTFVRYGEPDERIITQDGNYPHNQTWVYRHMADHPVSFDFWLMRNDARGWTLMADVVRCGGGNLPYSEFYLRDRMNVDPRYGLILAECGSHRPDYGRIEGIAMPMIKERREYLIQSTVQDNAVPRVTKNLDVAADVLQFAGTAGATDLTAVVVFPLADFVAKDGELSARLSLMIADTLHGSTMTRDTVVHVRAPSGPGSRARVYLCTPAGPGSQSMYRISLRDLNTQSAPTIIGDSIEVRRLPGSGLTLSDVALVSGEGGSWMRGDRKFSLLPRGTPTREFGIYYEIYNIAAGAKYQTTMSFDPADEGLAAIVQKLKGTRVVSFSFESSNGSSENTVRELRQVKTELPAGKYHLVLRVTSNVGSAQIERFIVLPK